MMLVNWIDSLNACSLHRELQLPKLGVARSIHAEEGIAISICISGPSSFGDNKSDSELFQCIGWSGSAVCQGRRLRVLPDFPDDFKQLSPWHSLYELFEWISFFYRIQSCFLAYFCLKVGICTRADFVLVPMVPFGRSVL